MKNVDMEAKIKQAFEHAAPDVLESVLSDCGEQKGTVIVMKERKINWIGRVAAVAAAVALVVVMLGAVGFSQKSVDGKHLEFYRIDRGPIEISALANGTVVPIFEQVINSPINSRILEVYCQQGSLLVEGTPILKLDLQSTESEYRKLLDEEKMRGYQLEQLRANNETALGDMAMKMEVDRMNLQRLEVEYRNERYLDSIGPGSM